MCGLFFCANSYGVSSFNSLTTHEYFFMNAATLKGYAITGLTVLAVLLVFNTIAKRVPAVAKVKTAVDNGF